VEKEKNKKTSEDSKATVGCSPMGMCRVVVTGISQSFGET
jgi:hypothetical protein